MPDETFSWIAAALVAVLGTARLARFGTEDSFPPIARLRGRWIRRFNDSDWAELATCAFCQAPYIAAVVVAWAVLSDFHWSWYLVMSWLSLSYLAAMVVARDIPDPE